MNYDRIPGLRASEQDADDQLDDQQDNGGKQTDNGAEDQEEDQGADDSSDDQTDDQDDDDNPDDEDDSGELSADEQGQRRRAIETRQRRSQPDPIDPVRLASETAAATARTLANESAAAQRAAVEEAQEREALAGMTEEQRATYQLAKTTRNLQNNQARTELLLTSNNDQIAFTRQLNRTPQYAKYEAEVEKRHQDILRQGGFTSRQVILAHLIGERALNAQGTVSKQKQEARKRVDNQRRGVQTRGRGGDSGGERAASARNNLVSRMERDDPVI